MALSLDVLRIDPADTAREIEDAMRRDVLGALRRRGVVVSLSDRVEDAVCAALAARAFGKQVLGVIAFGPDAPERGRLGEHVAEAIGLERHVVDLGPATAALREAGTTGSLVERLRKLVEYECADRLGYAVVGTQSRVEHDQGLFAKQGDGAADLKPIAHLYEAQVRALAAHLGVPGEVLAHPRPAPFDLSFAQMDLCLWAVNEGRPAAEVAAALGVSEDRVDAIFRDIDERRREARYLHARPLLVRLVDAAPAASPSQWEI